MNENLGQIKEGFAKLLLLKRGAVLTVCIQDTLALLITVTDKIIRQLAVVMNIRSDCTSFQQQLHRKSCFKLSQVFKTVLGWEMDRANVSRVELHRDLLRYGIQTSTMPVESILARL